VVDTNVLVSGLLSPHGPPGRIVDLLLARGLQLLVDDRVLDEYADVLRRPRFGFARSDVDALMVFLASSAERVSAPPLDVQLPDADDTPFLEVAAAAGADALVTGNTEDFVPRRGAHAVRVVTPAGLLALLARTG